MTATISSALGRAVGLLLFLAAAGGCGGGAEGIDRSAVSLDLERSLGHGLGPEAPPGERMLPPGISTADGVDAEEAVAIALWNNPAFQEALAELGVQRAGVLQAGLLTNPGLSILFPVGPKQLEFTGRLPLEALWLRGRRVALARTRAERAAALLVQGGLDLAREVRASFVELERTRTEAALAEEAAGVEAGLAELEAARLRAGEASEVEAALARAAQLRSREEARLAGTEVDLARGRLQALLGAGDLEFTASPSGGAGAGAGTAGGDALIVWALAARPDLRAAELALEEAGKAAGLSRLEAFGLSGLVDANSKGTRGFEIGPGIDVALPLFNWGQGVTARARAEVERAARRYLTVREGIAVEVREADARLRWAAAAERALQGEVVPLLEEAVDRAVRSRLAGEASDRQVLEARGRLIRTRRDAAALQAARRRAGVDLERGVGRRLGEAGPVTAAGGD